MLVVQPPMDNLVKPQSSLGSIIHLCQDSPTPTDAEIQESLWLYNTIISDSKAARVMFDPSTLSGISYADADSFPDDGYDDDEEDGNPRTDFPLYRFFRALYDHCPTTPGHTNVLRMVLLVLFPHSDNTTPINRSLEAILLRARRVYTPATHSAAFETLSSIAKNLLEGLFVPLKAQGGATPTFTSHSEASPAQAATPGRLSSLRNICLLRDGYRRVVTGHLDSSKRTRRNPGVSTDCTHIIPHALNNLESTGTLPHTVSLVWRIINLFDPNLSHTLEGDLIDTPCNAITLIHDLRELSSRLEAYFEAVPDMPNTYVFKATRTAGKLMEHQRPKAAQLTFCGNEPLGSHSAALPSARLLKFHAACCKILEMAGAAGYVEQVVEDMEELAAKGTMATDGSSDLGLFLRLKGLYESWRESEVVMAR